MRFLFPRIVTLFVSVGFLLSGTNIITFLATAEDSHSISFKSEHGIEHLILVHSIDLTISGQPDRLIQSTGEEDHEFHLAMLTGVISKKLTLFLFASDVLPEQNQIPAGNVSNVTPSCLEPDFVPLKRPVPVLRI